VSGGRPAAVSASGHRPDGQEWCPPRRWRRRAGRHAPDRVDGLVAHIIRRRHGDVPSIGDLLRTLRDAKDESW